MRRLDVPCFDKVFAAPLSKVASPPIQLESALKADPTSSPPSPMLAASASPTTTEAGLGLAEVAAALPGGQRDEPSSSGFPRETDAPQATPAVPFVPTSAPPPPVHTAPPVAADSNRPGEHKNTAKARDAAKCPTCNSGGDESRNLVICIDGTSNQFSIKNTNVVELYSRLERSKKQFTFYDSGIGTYAKPSYISWSYIKQVGANKLDLMFALRFEKIIMSAYRWLVDNYQEGDRIYMFGFSRGAYQVRALAAMLHTVGLLEKGNEDQIPFAYELFAASSSPATAHPGDNADTASGPSISSLSSRSSHKREDTFQCLYSTIKPVKSVATVMGRSLRKGASRSFKFIFPDSRKAKARKLLGLQPLLPHPEQAPSRTLVSDDQTLQQHFKETFSRAVNVHFIGAWDTVSSVGFIRGKTLPGTTDGMKHVCFFRHALAMHEYRVKFLPEYVNGGDGPDPESCAGGLPHTKECWFIGSHSDIGGGSTVNTTLQTFGPALRWMSFEAALAGLQVKEGPRQWERPVVSKSMTLGYRIMEIFPIKRLSYKTKDSSSWWPHFCSQRRIRPNQLIHETVLNECGIELSGLHDNFELVDGKITNRQENDAYTSAKALLEVPTNDAAWIDRLTTLWGTIPGQQSLLDLMDDILVYLEMSWRSRPAEDAARENICLLQAALFYGPSTFVHGMQPLSQLLGIQATVTHRAYPFALRGHTQLVNSVAFLSPQLVVSGSYDQTLCIWNIETGEAVGDPLTGHTDSISCVAVSPNGSLVASGSYDGTIRTWKFDAGKLVGGGLVIRADDMARAFSVAFSPDGLQIVSGSRDGALRIWDAETGRQVGNAMEGHDGWVRSVAFSPDGARIASGSSDRTVRSWDARAFQPLGDPLIGHTDYVRSVAFSPDGVSIASGSSDKTIRIWNSNTRELMHILAGHSSWVWSVAFSPSGRHIASASQDRTVRIWDAVRGEAVGVLKGHTNWVYSVAFSPDGTRIASGSWDDTVRIWDRIPVSSTDAT